MANHRSYKVFQGTDGQWYFTVKARNGQVLALSEGYTRRRDAYIGLDTLRDTLNEIPHKDRPTLTTRSGHVNVQSMAFDPGCA